MLKRLLQVSTLVMGCWLVGLAQAVAIEAGEPEQRPAHPYNHLGRAAFWQAVERDRMSPTQMRGATGSFHFPSPHGPFRNDPEQGIPKHAYSPFNREEVHCPSGGCDYVPDVLLVRFRPEVTVSHQRGAAPQFNRASLNEFFADLPVREVRRVFANATPPQPGARVTRPDGQEVPLPDLTRWHRIELEPDLARGGEPPELQPLIRRLRTLEDLDYVEPDYQYRTIGTPDPVSAPGTRSDPPSAGDFFDDPEIDRQWHLDAANVPAAWQFLADQGLPPGGSSDVIVAVIDTGVDYTHPDLAGSMWINQAEYNGTPGQDDDGNGYIDDIHGATVIAGAISGDPMDDHGHGTHVAGIIAAQGNNNEGGVGVAPNVRIMAIKAAQFSGVLNASDIARGIEYAIDNGADIINMSFGGYARSQVVEDALANAFGFAVLVAAAGNDGRPNVPCPFGANMYPASYNWVLGVMSRNELPNALGDHLSDFSNYDCVPNDLQEYELMAPGAGIYSTLPFGGYGAWSGTSMAAPVVSGMAALARTRWPDKAVHSSRFLMGQLAVTGPLMQAYSTPEGGLVNFRSADAFEALATVPQPELSYLEHWVFDTTDIDPDNNPNGIVDAGETIELAIVIRNHWGRADNVEVRLEAWPPGAVQADPWVEMLIDTVGYGSVGSFNQKSNGFVLDEEGVPIGVVAPFRFRTLPNTPNDHVIVFRLTITADNGYDTAAPPVSSESYFFQLVQSGTELPRLIDSDMELDDSRLWLVPDGVLVDENATLSIGPGARLQFFSTDPSDPFAESYRPKILVRGALNVAGEATRPVEFFPSVLYQEYPIVMRPSGLGIVDIDHARIMNPVIGSWSFYDTTTGNTVYPAQSIANSYFGQVVPECMRDFWRNSVPGFWRGCQRGPVVNAHDITASVFYELGNSQTAWSLDFGSSNISGSLLDGVYASGGSAGGGVPNNFTDTVFLRNHRIQTVGLRNSSLRITTGSILHGNAFLNNWSIMNPDYWLRLIMAESSGTVVSVANNFWGTESSTLIEASIFDFNNNFNLGIIDYQPILIEAPVAAYPFVVNVEVDADGVTNEVGAEEVTFTVRFNRDMDNSVNPLVSFGPDVPYTDFVIPGAWVDSKTWVGEFMITPLTGDGWQYLRVIGAAAADNPWLVTGNDFARFRFEVSTSGALGMNLQASGEEGLIRLSWAQTDFDTLAGYNLYRAPAGSTDFTRVNAAMVPQGMTTWEDTSVMPGQMYHYYFTVVQTNLSESDPSNIAVAAALDTISPEISHTPVTLSVYGQSVTIRADVTDNVAVTGVTLFHRLAGETSWQQRTMALSSGIRYSASIPGSQVASPGVEYYIQATDGINTTRHGRPDLPHLIQVDDRPLVTSISPTVGPASGGTAVIISGSRFQAGATARVGGIDCSDLTVVSESRIDCTTGPSIPGTVDVRVDNPSGEPGFLLNGFTYQGEVASLGFPDLEGRQGTELQIPLTAANVDGLVSVDVQIDYDPSVLSAENVQLGNLTSGWFIVSNLNEPGSITVSMATGGSPVSGDGNLLILRFGLIGAPESFSSISFGTLSLNDGAISALTNPGSITVESYFEVAGAVTFWNESRPVPETVLSMTGDGAYQGVTDNDGSFVVGGPSGNYSLTPSRAVAEGGISAYDASLVLQHASGLQPLAGPAFLAADVNRSGSVNSFDAYLILQYTVGLSELPFTGAGKIWLFEPGERQYAPLNEDLANQNFTAILIGDPSGNWYPAESAPDSTVSTRDTALCVRLELTHEWGDPGDEIVMPLILWGENPSFHALELTLTYDENVVDALGVELAPEWTGAGLQYNEANEGELRLSVASAEPFDHSGTLAYLRFIVTGEAGEFTAITPSFGRIDEYGVGAMISSGLIEVGRTDRLLHDRFQEPGCVIYGKR